MDAYQKEMNEKRGTQTVTLDRRIPLTNEYLKLVYVLPEPYTCDEYNAALDDFNQRWEAGERSEG